MTRETTSSLSEAPSNESDEQVGSHTLTRNLVIDYLLMSPVIILCCFDAVG